MVLPLGHTDDEERPREPLPKICPVCRQVNTLRVCQGCGIDLETGELVEPPPAKAWAPDLSAERQRRRLGVRRTPAGLLQAVLSESLRRWVFMVFLMLGLVPLWAVDAPLLVMGVVAYAIALRSRVALGSALVMGDPVFAAGEDTTERPPLRARDLVLPLGQAAAATVLASPLVIAVLTGDRLADLQQIGFLTLAGGVYTARALALATVFVTVAAVSVALRLRHGHVVLPKGALRNVERLDPFEALACVPKACLLTFPLFALARYPASLLVWIPLLPLVIGALASAWEDLSPPALWQAWRTTPRYGVFVALSAVPLILLAMCLAFPVLGIELAVPGLALSASAVGILAGIARQDCEASQRLAEREALEEADDEADDEAEADSDELPYLPRV